ncbi:transketolase family protein [Patescibacteria group bacterium]|nr:transketolase family protein [Patescibacteria group bacterium]
MFASHLDPAVGTSDVKQVPSRNGYGDGLVEAGTRDNRIVALSADLTESTRTLPFAEKFPKRFIQVGITEQNMASVAAGMSAMGKIPFIASYAMFSPGRNWEQIRTTIAYNESNVKIIGAHAGVSVGPDGATHQAIEDIALMRVIPKMIVIAPADEHEARKATLAAAQYEGPVYIRIGRSNTPVATTVESPFVIGKAEQLAFRDEAHEKRVGIVVTGTLLHNALVAAKELNEQGIGASVLHMATIKPLDTEALLSFAEEHRSLVTVEEHQRSGGLGGAVAEYLSEVRPTRIARIGVHDQFGQSGEPDELIAHYGMDTASIVAAAHKGAQ